MWKLARWMADGVGSLGHVPTRTLGRIEISARGQFVNCLYPRPRKFRDVASAFEILVEAGRPKQRHSNECRSRYRESSEARPGDSRDIESSRQAMTIATAVAAAASRIHQRKAGNIASRNAVVSRSTIITSTKSIVIQSLSNLKRDSSVSATRISSEISAATVGLRSKASHRQLSMIQTSRKTAMPDEADFGRDHEDHRACVQQQRQAESGHPAAAGPLRGDAADGRRLMHRGTFSTRAQNWFRAHDAFAYGITNH